MAQGVVLSEANSGKGGQETSREAAEEREGATERKGITTYYIFIFLALLRLPQMVSLELKAAIHLLNRLLYQHKHLQHDKQNQS